MYQKRLQRFFTVVQPSGNIPFFCTTDGRARFNILSVDGTCMVFLYFISTFLLDWVLMRQWPWLTRSLKDVILCFLTEQHEMYRHSFAWSLCVYCYRACGMSKVKACNRQDVLSLLYRSESEMIYSRLPLMTRAACSCCSKKCLSQARNEDGR
jgi:hypothetical protein